MRRALIFHDCLDIYSGAEYFLLYVLKFFENIDKTPYIVATFTNMHTFPYINKLVERKPQNFVSFVKHKYVYTQIVDASKFLFKIRRTFKPNLLFITQGAPAPLFSLIFSRTLKDVDVKIMRLTTNALNILTGYMGGHKLSLMPARLLSRTLANSCDFKNYLFLANSPEMRHNTLKFFPNLNVEVLFTPFDNTFFYPRIDLKEISILMAGRIHPSKNICAGLNILAKVKELIDGVKLYIVGEVYDQRYLEHILKRIKELSLRKNVIIVTDGRQEIIRNYMWKSKVSFGVSSGYHGITNVECLACGAMPIVLPNLKSSVGDYGYVAFDRDDFIDLTVKILTSPINWQRILRGYEWAESMFSPQVFFKRLNEIFENLA
ncbi:MAG: glycosyltransferase [Nitrososphaerales archaeon]|nr:glycosyltransferase [Nitrososphaerales archaeon]